MARPRKEGVKSFPFDIDLFQDEKVVCVAGEFGNKAEITLVKLLCAVYRNGYFLEWTEKNKLKLLHALPIVSAGLLDQIVGSLLKWGFFDMSLFKSANILTSKGIQRRYFKAVKFRRIGKNSLPYLLIDPPKSYAKEGVSQQLTPVSQYKNGVSQQLILQKNDEKTDISQQKTNVSQQLTGVSQQLTPVSQYKTPLKEDDDNINNNINNINNNSSSSSSGECEGGGDLMRQVRDYKTNERWITDIMLKFKLNRDEVIGYLDDFYLDMQCREIKVRKLSAVFVPWLTEIQKENGNNNRRGSPSGGSRKGYTAPDCGLYEGARE